MSEIVIRSPDETRSTAETSAVVGRATRLTVATQDEHAQGLTLLRDISGMRAKVVDLFAESKQAAHRAHKAITAAERRLLDPLDQAKRIVDVKCGDYEARVRLQAEKERRRLELEALNRDNERRLEEAIAAEQSGNFAEADAIWDAPAQPVVIHVEAAVAKIDGVSSRTNWRAEVVDLLELVRHVAAHPEHLNLLEPRTTSLNQLARSLQANMSIPGVRAVSETIRAVRS